MARATVTLLGNFLACGECIENLWPYHHELGRLLVAANTVFSTDMPVGRMLARALNYIYEHRMTLELLAGTHCVFGCVVAWVRGCAGAQVCRCAGAWVVVQHTLSLALSLTHTHTPQARRVWSRPYARG